MTRKAPDLKDVEAAHHAMKKFMENVVGPRSGVGSAFMSGWVQGLRHQMSRYQQPDAKETLQSALLEFLQHHSAKDIVNELGEILEGAAREAELGSNPAVATTLYYQAHQLSEVSDALEDLVSEGST